MNLKQFLIAPVSNRNRLAENGKKNLESREISTIFFDKRDHDLIYQMNEFSRQFKRIKIKKSGNCSGVIVR